MKAHHFYPLIGFVVPTLVIGYGMLIPRSCIAGINDLTVGFASTVVGACVTYWFGLRAVLRDSLAGPAGHRRCKIMTVPPLTTAPHPFRSSRLTCSRSNPALASARRMSPTCFLVRS